MSTTTQYDTIPMVPKHIKMIIDGTKTTTLRTRVFKNGFYVLRENFVDKVIVHLRPADQIFWPLGDRMLALRHEIAAKEGYGENLEAFENEIRAQLNVRGHTGGDDFMAGKRALYLYQIDVVEVLE